MNKRITITIAVFFIATTLFIFSASTNFVFNKHVDYPKKMNFCNENVPTQITDVAERLDREMSININLNSTTSLLIKRANKAFEIIEPILAKNNVPDDFKYLAVIESGLVNAVSPAGARGVWQFMPQTAIEKGLEVNDYVDERYDLKKSTEAACKYLLSAKQKFGNWTMAAASYNGGMSGLQKQMDSQKQTDYYDLWLTEETYRYVFRILALKEIMKNPEKYGYNIPTEALYKNITTNTIKIDSTINDLSDFAIKQGTNYKVLRTHNPWLRDKKLLNLAKKTYEIEIPISGYNK